jgi:hypothetical protein
MADGGDSVHTNPSFSVHTGDDSHSTARSRSTLHSERNSGPPRKLATVEEAITHLMENALELGMQKPDPKKFEKYFRKRVPSKAFTDFYLAVEEATGFSATLFQDEEFLLDAKGRDDKFELMTRLTICVDLFQERELDTWDLDLLVESGTKDVTEESILECLNLMYMTILCGWECLEGGEAAAERNIYATDRGADRRLLDADSVGGTHDTDAGSMGTVGTAETGGTQGTVGTLRTHGSLGTVGSQGSLVTPGASTPGEEQSVYQLASSSGGGGGSDSVVTAGASILGASTAEEGSSALGSAAAPAGGDDDSLVTPGHGHGDSVVTPGASTPGASTAEEEGSSAPAPAAASAASATGDEGSAAAASSSAASSSASSSSAAAADTTGAKSVVSFADEVTVHSHEETVHSHADSSSVLTAAGPAIHIDNSYIDACTGEWEVTVEMLSKIIRKPKPTEKLLKKPPFRFLHDVVTAVTTATGFGNGLIEGDELIAKGMDKGQKLAYFEKVVKLVECALNVKVKATKENIIHGVAWRATNQLLQLLTVAATHCPYSSTYVQMAKCNGDVELTISMLGGLIRKPKPNEKLLMQPPFRFLHDVFVAVTKATGFAEGLFDREELVAKGMDKENKLSCLNKFVKLINAALNATVDATPQAMLTGREWRNTNKLLQLLVVAATEWPDSTVAVAMARGEWEGDDNASALSMSSQSAAEAAAAKAKEDEEARLKAEQEAIAAAKAQAAEEARLKAEQEAIAAAAKAQAEEEEARLVAVALEEAAAAAKAQAEEEARKKAEEEAPASKTLAEEEEARVRAEQEAAADAAQARFEAEQEAARAKAETEAEDKARLEAEQEAEQAKAAEAARLKAEDEALKAKAEDAARTKAEQEVAKARANEEARRKAEEETIARLNAKASRTSQVAVPLVVLKAGPEKAAPKPAAAAAAAAPVETRPSPTVEDYMHARNMLVGSCIGNVDLTIGYCRKALGGGPMADKLLRSEKLFTTLPFSFVFTLFATITEVTGFGAGLFLAEHEKSHKTMKSPELKKEYIDKVKLLCWMALGLGRDPHFAQDVETDGLWIRMLEEAQQVDVRVIIQYFAVAAVSVPSSRAAECVAAVLKGTEWLDFFPTPLAGIEITHRDKVVDPKYVEECTGEVELTISMLGKLIQKPKASVKLLTKPPFRFLHDVFSEVTRTTGFGEGLLDEDEKEAKFMEKDARLAYLEKVTSLVNVALKTTVDATPESLLEGTDFVHTNRLLQLFAVGATHVPDSQKAVAKVLRNSSKGAPKNSNNNEALSASARNTRARVMLAGPIVPEGPNENDYFGGRGDGSGDTEVQTDKQNRSTRPRPLTARRRPPKLKESPFEVEQHTRLLDLSATDATGKPTSPTKARIHAEGATDDFSDDDESKKGSSPADKKGRSPAKKTRGPPCKHLKCHVSGHQDWGPFCMCAKAPTTGKLKWTIAKWDDVDNTKDVPTVSPTMACAGHNWSISIYSGGNPLSATKSNRASAESSVAMYLHYEGSRDVGAFGLKGKARGDAIREFKKLDKNGNGLLDLEELMDGCWLLKLSKDVARKWFYEIDRDGSGEISAEEFVDMYEVMTTAKVETAFDMRIVNQFDPGQNDIVWSAPGGVTFTSGPASTVDKLYQNYGTTRFVRMAAFEDQAKGWKVGESVMIEVDIQIVKDAGLDDVSPEVPETLSAAPRGGDATPEETDNNFGRSHVGPKYRTKNEYDVVMSAVKRHWSSLEHAPAYFRREPEMVMAAVRQNPHSMAFATADLRRDRMFMLDAVKFSWHTLQYASGDIDVDLLGDREIVLEAVKQDGAALQFASSRLQNERRVTMTAVESNGRALQYCGAEMKKDREIVLAAVENYEHALQYAAPEVRQDRDFIQRVIKGNGYALEDGPLEMQSDRESVLKQVTEHWTALQVASGELKGDREIVMAAVKQNGSALMYASAELRGDEEIAMEAVRNSGRALQFCSKELKGNEAVVMEAVKNVGFALQYASVDLKRNPTFMMETIKQNGRSLQFAAPELKSDRTFMMETIQLNSRALQFASPKLKSDRTFVQEATSPIKSPTNATYPAATSLLQQEQQEKQQLPQPPEQQQPWPQQPQPEHRRRRDETGSLNLSARFQEAKSW